MPLSNDLDRKYFQALLTGVTQLLPPASISVDYLVSQIFPGSKLSETDQLALIDQLYNLLHDSVKEGLEFDEFEKLILEREYNKEISNEQIACLLFWYKTEGPKLHSKVLENSQWEMNAKLSWRIDIKIAERAKNEESGAVNEPTAIVELALGSKNERKDVAQFEMNRTEIAEFVKRLDSIQAAIIAAGEEKGLISSDTKIGMQNK